MRSASSALLVAAAVTSHLLESACGDVQSGRYGARFRRSDLTSTVDGDGSSENGGPRTIETASYIEPQTETAALLSSSTRHRFGATTSPAKPTGTSQIGSSSSTFSSTSTDGRWLNMTSTTATWTMTADSDETTASEDSFQPPLETSTSSKACYPTGDGVAPTVFSIIKTSTITWHGDPKDYTPEFPPIDIPTPCPEDPETETLWPSSSLECGITCIELVLPTPHADDEDANDEDADDEDADDADGIYISPTRLVDKYTYTFYTTDRNPAVVYPGSTSVPDYGGDSRVSVDNGGGHVTADGGTDNNVPGYGWNPDHGNLKSAQQPSAAEVTIEDRPTEVVINGVTITNSPANPSITVVTVDIYVFTVGPSAIVGAGATVTRKAQSNNAFVPVPTTTNVGGLQVVVSKSVAIVDGTTFTLGSAQVTQTVDGSPVAVGPGGVVVGDITIPVAVATSANVVAVGGELITAIGRSIVVVQGTTYTYGPGSATITKVVDDDTIYIGPSGFMIDGTLYGGPTAGTSQVTYQVVGGATITQMGVSVVIIDDVTYTVGAGAGTTTTVVGGETLTIAPGGVTVSGGLTIPYPFGPTATTTLKPGATASNSQASPTGDDEEGMACATAGKPNWRLLFISYCIMVGVGIFGLIG